MVKLVHLGDRSNVSRWTLYSGEAGTPYRCCNARFSAVVAWVRHGDPGQEEGGRGRLTSCPPLTFDHTPGTLRRHLGPLGALVAFVSTAVGHRWQQGRGRPWLGSVGVTLSYPDCKQSSALSRRAVTRRRRGGPNAGGATPSSIRPAFAQTQWERVGVAQLGRKAHGQVRHPLSGLSSFSLALFLSLSRARSLSLSLSLSPAINAQRKRSKRPERWPNAPTWFGGRGVPHSSAESVRVNPRMPRQAFSAAAQTS